MTTIPGVIRNGQIHPVESLANLDQKYCLITVVDEDIDELRRQSGIMLDNTRQDRLSELLQINKENQLTDDEEQELDTILVEVHQLTVRRARDQTLATTTRGLATHVFLSYLNETETPGRV